MEVDDAAAGDTSQVATYPISAGTFNPSQLFEPGLYQHVRRLTGRVAEVCVERYSLVRNITTNN